MWTKLYSSIQQYSHICFTYKNTVYNHFVIFVDDNLKRLPIGQTKRQYGRGTKIESSTKTMARRIITQEADLKMKAMKSS